MITVHRNVIIKSHVNQISPQILQLNVQRYNRNLLLWLVYFVCIDFLLSCQNPNNVNSEEKRFTLAHSFRHLSRRWLIGEREGKGGSKKGDWEDRLPSFFPVNQWTMCLWMCHLLTRSEYWFYLHPNLLLLKRWQWIFASPELLLVQSVFFITETEIHIKMELSY